MRTNGVELMEEYPYRGKFYVTETVDDTLPLVEQTEREITVLSVDCDIQQSSQLGNAGFKVTSYDVYFLFDGKLPIRRGMFFRGEAYGYVVDGEVEGIGFSQCADSEKIGCVCQIKDRTE